MTDLSALIAHGVWANEAWVDFVADRGASDAFLVARISHVLLGERAWMQRLDDVEPDRDIWRALTIPELRAACEAHRVVYDRLLAGNLDRVIGYTRFTGEQYRSTVADILLHLALHGAHHRGQMATRVASSGAEPPNTDFIQFCMVTGR